MQKKVKSTHAGTKNAEPAFKLNRGPAACRPPPGSRVIWRREREREGEGEGERVAGAGGEGKQVRGATTSGQRRAMMRRGRNWRRRAAHDKQPRTT